MNELSSEETRLTGNGLASRARASASPKVSVVLATYNRGPILVRLLRQLAAQDFPADEMEVVVVDDGSREPAASLLEPLRSELPYRLLVLTQANAGAAAARQRAVMHASGELLVILDDDMQIRPEFISEHARIHRDTPEATTEAR